MPETPDFDQVARQSADAVSSLSPTGLTSFLSEQFRCIWNARGAADIAMIDASESVSPEPPDLNEIAMLQYSLLKARRDWWREGYAAATHSLERALRRLDR